MLQLLLTAGQVLLVEVIGVLAIAAGFYAFDKLSGNSQK